MNKWVILKEIQPKYLSMTSAIGGSEDYHVMTKNFLLDLKRVKRVC